METIEYRTVDKSDWADGPWKNEPDKRQWQDPETGLPCLIVRGPAGALCGYVGVPKGHPWHGMGYSGNGEWGSPEREKSPEAVVDVHGGLTFAGGCRKPTREGWEKMRANYPAWEKEAKKFPRGDAAERVKVNRPYLEDYAAWAEWIEQGSICHRADGEDDTHWFGFDCAHAGDFCPKFDSIGARSFDGDVYRDIGYVTAEVTALAKQLAAVK